MTDAADVNEPVTPHKSSAVQRTNRGILLFVLFAGTVFSLFLTELGVSDAVAFCLDAVVVLVALQLLLRGTNDSPLAVLKRYREVSLPTAIGATALLLTVNVGVSTFASAFVPRLYSVLALFEPMSSFAWELAFFIFGFALLAPFYEELVFRGLALKAYRDARSTLFAVLFTSALFGFVHGSIIHILYVFPVGIILALVMLKTGQLWTVIAAHGLHNLTVTLLIEFNVPEIPATPVFGLLGLAVAVAAFWVAVRWTTLPLPTPSQDESTERETIWTASLVVVLVIAAISIVVTTYIALGPGVETIL